MSTTFENGMRVAMFDYLGNFVGTGRVRSGDNYPASNESTTWVTTTMYGETRTDEWPTQQLKLESAVTL